MDDILEEMLYECQVDEMEQSIRHWVYLCAIVKIQNKLRTTLDEEQNKLLTELTSQIREMNRIRTGNAFVKGVRLAIQDMLADSCDAKDLFDEDSFAFDE